MSREEDVREWMARAERDQRAARHPLESGDFEACALHCQQAVEKLLKAGISRPQLLLVMGASAHPKRTEVHTTNLNCGLLGIVSQTGQRPESSG